MMEAKATGKIEITCHPEEVNFRDEGGRFNYLFVFFVIRASNLSDHTAPVACDLIYEDGSEVASVQDKPNICLYGSAGTKTMSKESTPICTILKYHGSVRFKITKLSRNHDSKRFQVRIRLEGVDSIQCAVTRPITVLSKRKWLNAGERIPENEQRDCLERIANEENIKIAKCVTSSRVLNSSPNLSVREILGMKSLERDYPVLRMTQSDADEPTQYDCSSEEEELFTRKRKISDMGIHEKLDRMEEKLIDVMRRLEEAENSQRSSLKRQLSLSRGLSLTRAVSTGDPEFFDWPEFALYDDLLLGEQVYM